VAEAGRRADPDQGRHRPAGVVVASPRPADCARAVAVGGARAAGRLAGLGDRRPPARRRARGVHHPAAAT
jgi:hypothetical protein